jgi:hypothetical protein
MKNPPPHDMYKSDAMENKKIPVIAVALFAIVILLFQNNLPMAYAITVTTVSYGLAGDGYVKYDSFVSSYVIANTGTIIKVINANNFGVTTVTLPTPITGYTYGFGISCIISTTCQITETKTTGSNFDSYIISFNILTGAITGNVTVADSATFSRLIYNAGSNDGWFNLACDNGNTILIKSDLTTLGDCAGTNFGAQIVRSIFVSGTTTAVTTDAATNAFSLWTGSVRSCLLNIGTAGDISRTTSEWLVRTVNTIDRVNSSCSVTGTLTHGLTTVYGVKANVIRHEIYVRGDSFVQVMNMTDFTKLYRLDVLESVAPTAFDNFAVATNVAEIGVRFADTGVNTGRMKIQIFQLGATAPEEGGETSTFCQQPENVNLLTCRLESEGGALSQVSASETFGNSTLHICQQIKLCDPNNDDIKTNGLGYLLVAIGLGVMTAIFWLASGGKLKEIPTFVWFIGTLSVLGAFTAFGFVDVTFFIVGILVIIALASAKIVQHLDLGGF